LILFCDTSALVKLYVAETDTDRMLAQAASARVIAVARVTWAEVHAALARRTRECPADASAMELVRQRLAVDWPSYFVMEITQALVELAGDYADTFALRGYDSVQLAAAAQLQKAAGEAIAFACFDARLCKAASVLGMQMNVAQP
jgi:predicted nucleic acid-binding protein